MDRQRGIAIAIALGLALREEALAAAVQSFGGGQLQRRQNRAWLLPKGTV